MINFLKVSDHLTAKQKAIIDKIISNERLNTNEGLELYNFDLGVLGILADYINQKKNNNRVYFNKNIHIEPTNICIYDCKFCSYHRKVNQEGSWEYSIDDILKIIELYKNSDITEVHIVGGVHPHRDLYYYGEMIQKIKNIIPTIHIKAFTAVELEFMIRKAHLEPEEGLKQLKDFGLDSIPGGGAEIFNPEIRKQVCHKKSTAEQWLKIHEIAHKLGIPSNATMLYGHIENYKHRIDHLNQLRQLQDKTNGFNTFIPLKYKKANNPLTSIGEVNTLEDLKNFAVSRIFLDNFTHLKAYWPMLGKETSQITLSFGVDDIDGTIDDSTKIYSMAGAKEQKPTMTSLEIIELIKQAGKKPIERDTNYKILREYN
ncbi:MAG: aminodeoxyfutalosine synthase [Bacteroidales bacterium]|nr:aminodeoxyfutalosine synthase [Bacteroidales bacterium]